MDQQSFYSLTKQEKLTPENYPQAVKAFFDRSDAKKWLRDWEHKEYTKEAIDSDIKDMA